MCFKKLPFLTKSTFFPLTDKIFKENKKLKLIPGHAEHLQKLNFICF